MRSLSGWRLPIIALLISIITLRFLWTVANPWSSVPLPPLPLYAQGLEVGYPSTGDTRWVRYNTDRSFDDLKAFYRKELPPEGWHYRCTVTPADPPCGIGNVWSPSGRLLVFDQGTPGTPTWQTFEVRIETDPGTGRHTVAMDQQLARSASPPAGAAQGASVGPLVGDWKTTGTAAESNVILRFDAGGRLAVLVPFSKGIPGFRGTYRLDGTTVQLSVATELLLERDLTEHCAAAPAFLATFCRASVVPSRPAYASYPAPSSTTAMTPATSGALSETAPAGSSAAVNPYPLPAPPTRALNAYPLPTPATRVESRIDASFTATLNDDTLVLVHDQGISQTFERVRSE